MWADTVMEMALGARLRRTVGRSTVAALVFACAAAPAAQGDSTAIDGADFVQGQLIVQFTDDSTRAQRGDARRESGVNAIEGLGVAGVQLVQVADGSLPEALDSLRDAPAVSGATRNWIRRPLARPSDPYFGLQWGLSNTGQSVLGVSGIADADIDAPEAWDVTTGDPGVVVAVMDTGVDMTHPDLVNQLWENPGESGPGEPDGIDSDGNGYVDDRHGYDFVGDSVADLNDDDSDPTDEDGHGTHVAGTVLAEGDNGVGVTGVSQQGALMVLRACGFDVDDEEVACPDSAILEALGYAVRNGAGVLNGSLGGPGFSPAELLVLSGSPDMLFVFAAGNGGDDGVGDDNDTTPTYPCAIDEELGYTTNNLICVAATDQNDARAGFSNFGSTSVDLAAPGVRTLSTYPEALTPPEFLPYAYLSGTSMATPHVTGAAALLLGDDSSATPSQVKDTLLSSVDQLSNLSALVASGGRLNVARALGLEPGPAHPGVGPVEPTFEPAPSAPSATPTVLSASRSRVETFIAQGPAKISFTSKKRKRVIFRFRSSEGGSTFLCKIDAKPYQQCGTKLARRFAVGKHVLWVKARDAAGNVDPTPAVYRFQVKRLR